MNNSEQKSSARLHSLDALRGFDMLFIMGGSGLIAAIASLFPDSSIWMAIKEQMGHVAWEGLRHHDTIFPLFLFIAGVSFPFSLQKQLDNGKSATSIRLKVIRRGLTLVFLGLIYSNMLRFEFETLRLCSVLARIGLAWMFGALIYTFVKSNKIRVAVIIGILLAYWMINALIVAPDAPVGADVFSKEGNIGCFLDRYILGIHSYRPEYDPEGLLSTIPAIGTAMLGMLSGEWIKKDGISGSKKALGLALAGVGLGIISWIWDFAFPINKSLWSSSFVCAVGSYSLIMLALFYYVIDVIGWRKWAFFFVVIGMNSITIYLAQRFVPFWDIQHRIFDGTINLFPDSLRQIVVETTYILTCWGFLYFLYKHKIFLKV